ncbi:Ribonuclease 3 [Halotydeus destructor]|nr:Ribonuclease 3 [Halotydeus destructor]
MSFTPNLGDLQKDIGYKFKDESLLTLALTHRSLSKVNNERLEFLGDSIINGYITVKLFDLFRDKEGQLTEFRSQMVCNRNLDRIASSEKLQLQRYIRIGADIVSLKKSYYMADFLEALVGAIFIDSGSDAAAKEFIMTFIWNSKVGQVAPHWKVPELTPLAPQRFYFSQPNQAPFVRYSRSSTSYSNYEPKFKRLAPPEPLNDSGRPAILAMLMNARSQQDMPLDLRVEPKTLPISTAQNFDFAGNSTAREKVQGLLRFHNMTLDHVKVTFTIKKKRHVVKMALEPFGSVTASHKYSREEATNLAYRYLLERILHRNSQNGNPSPQVTMDLRHKLKRQFV